jgi:hypothetical protein
MVAACCPLDPSNPKLAHLDGLNLSRAWILEEIAAGLPKNDKRLQSIIATTTRTDVLVWRL